MFSVEPLTDPLVLVLEVTLCKTDPVEDVCDTCDSRLSAASAPVWKSPFASANESDRTLMEGAAIFPVAVVSLGWSCMSSSDSSVSELEFKASWLTACAISGRFGSISRISTQSPCVGRCFRGLDLLLRLEVGGLTKIWVTIGGGSSSGFALTVTAWRGGVREPKASSSV